ncbi:MAG: FGGY-family carbohydrate kinase [Planctomycetota bacterium]
MKSREHVRSVLAIDLGSGGPKAAVVTEEGEILGRGRASIGMQLLPNGGVEQVPEEWWRAIVAAVGEALRACSRSKECIVAIACTSQWSVTTPVDRDGNALMPAIHWMDARGAAHSQKVTDGILKIEGYGVRSLWHWIRLTGGIPPHSGADCLSHILFIKNERPEVYDRTHKFLEPSDYINLRLTGRAVSSAATAFPLLLTDNRNANDIHYSEFLIRKSGIDRDKLPDILPVGSVVGPLLPSIAEEWGLSPSVQVVTGTGDSQAAVLGSGAVADYEAHLCIGTSSWLTCHVPFKKTDVFHSLATMPAALPGRNMVVAEQGPAGKCLDCIVDRWLAPKEDFGQTKAGPNAHDRLLAEAAKVPPGSEGLLFLPWLNGAGPPTGDSNMRGGFLNQCLHTGREHAVRAVLEGVGFNLRWLAHHVERFIGRKIDAMNFIGGGARSELWCQILADILQRELRQVNEPSFTIARGAAFYALLALGILGPNDLARKVKIAKAFTPNPENRLVYAGLHDEFLRAYRANRKTFARMAKYRTADRRG